MATLNLTFVDGTTADFPFTAASQLTITTPDGTNGDRYGSWGEIAHLELADDAEPVTAAAEPDATPEPEPAPDETADGKAK